jgi:hypothetical protein
MHDTIEQTISKEQVRERRLASRLKTLRHPTHAPFEYLNRALILIEPSTLIEP